MTKSEEKLYAIVQRELGIEPGRITPSSRLADFADSLEWLSLLLAIEEAFDIDIGHEQSESLHTVADLLRLIEVPAVA